MGNDQPMTDQAFIVRSEMNVKEGRLDDLVDANEQITNTVREFEPAMMSFVQFFDEDRSRVAGFQLHPTAASFEYHLQVMADKISTARDALELTTLAVYGPSSPGVDAYLDRMRGMGFVVEHWPSIMNGFSRFTVPDEFTEEA